MKRISSLIMLLLLVCSITFAQRIDGYTFGPNPLPSTVSPVSNRLSPADFQRLESLSNPSTQGANRTIQNVDISYFRYADTMAAIASDSVLAFYWGINQNFPDNLANTNRNKWATVLFDSIADYATLQSYTYPTAAPLSVDSVDVYFRYINNSSSLDTIIFAVYVYDTVVGLSADSISIANTPTYTDTLFVNQTINTGNLSVYTLIPPSGLQVTSTQRFAVSAYFKGDVANNFQIPASYTKPCLNACEADEPTIFNSAYWMVYWITTNRISGINPGVYFDCDGSTTLTPGACELFPLHNFFIEAYVSFDDLLAGPQPVADFVGAPTTITAGQSVNFTDLSTNSPTVWNWTFSGAVTTGSSIKNPAGITYNTPGQYPVTLIATNAFGSDTITKLQYITVNPLSGATCDTLTNIFVNDTANLYGVSGGGGVILGHNDFGDIAKADLFTNSTTGQVTAVDLGLVVVASGGSGSSVTVTVWNANGTAGAPGTVLASQPLLLSAINSGGITPVSFSNPANVTGNFYVGIQLNYGVGDTVGIIHTQARTPATAWEQESNGVWSSIATNWTFNTSLFVFPTVCPLGALLNADFVANQTNITVGGSVNFTDLSTGNPTGWAWSFPGGAPALSSTQNPSNITYNAVGQYDVTLIVTNGTSFDTLTKPNYIRVTSSATQLVCDTFGNIYTNDTANLFGVGGGGYISGHNSYGDLAKADFFVNQSPGSDIYEAILYFAVADNGGGTVNVVVWDDNGTAGAPGTVLATETITIASIAADITANRPTVVTFGTPASPTGDYYVGFEFTYAPGDTVALIHTQDRGLGQLNTAWEKFSSNQWFAFDDASSWNFAMSHYIFPIQCDVVTCPTLTGVLTPNAATCTASNGSISAVASGGTSPYSYAWSTSPLQNGPTATNLAAGNYTVTFTDVNGCTGTGTATVGTTSATISPNVTVQNATCLAANGSATASPSGGTQPYSYAWSGGGNSATKTGLAVGGYSLTITDANGCTVVASVTVAATSGNLTASSSSVPATCTASNGSATVAPSGGLSPYTYTWSGGGSNATKTGLAAGNYSVTIADANGCSLVTSVTVGVNNGSIASTTTTTQATCGASDGSATLNVSGSTGAVTYLWGANAGNQSTATATSLAAGTYLVTATDANGCVTTNSATVVDPGSPQITQSGGSNVGCFGGSNGSVSVTVTGGTAPYTYTWSVGGSTGPINSGLSAGTVSLTVTDQSGCSNLRSFTITQPSAAISASVTGTRNLTCPGAINGYVAAAAAGGTAPYTFTWNTNPIQTNDTAFGLAAGTYTVTVADANGCSTTTSGTVNAAGNPVTVSVNSSQTTGCGLANATLTANVTGGAPTYQYSWSSGATAATATNLAAGIYTVTVLDAGGCTASASGTVSDPGAHSVGVIAGAVSCYDAGDGTISLAVTGGSGNYSYNWSPAVAGSSSNTASGLDGGSYNITVTDNVSNCVVPVTAFVSEPDSIKVVFTKTDVSCFGGSNGFVTASASGGNGGPFVYTWLPSGTTGSALTGQSASTVILQVTDANTCVKNITVNIGQPAAINLSMAKTDISCNGGSDGTATVTATGGTGGFSYTWSTVPSQSGPVANGLGAGTYTVTATDGNGCTATQSVNIVQPSVLTVSIAGSNVSCAGGSNGSALASGSGGTGAITYAWSTNPAQNGASAANLTAGGYSVTATDSKGCTATATVTIGQPTALSLAGSVTPVTCAGGNDGTASVAPTGGTGNITYAWNTSPSQSTITATGLTAGSYSVTATDQNGCTASASVTVGAGASVTATASATNVLCNGGSTGTATITATGGTPSYLYTWSSGGSAAIETGLSAGSYNFTVADGNGCSTTGSVVVGTTSSITVTPNPVAASCNGGTDGAINLTVSGGAGNYTYSWSNTTSSQNLSNVAAGTYSVTVTDGSGCTAVASNLVVNEATAITVTATATNETATGANDGTATASATGGTGLINFIWSNTQTGANQSNLAPGTYTVTATDANGCEAVATVTVSEWTGFANILAISSFEMYPNPTSGEVNMTIELTKPALVTVEMYNVIGERIAASSYEDATVINERFDLGNMAEGMYFARVTVNGESFIRKIIVSK